MTNIASVESMNGAPRIAPTPISSDDAPLAKTIAMIGMRVSGSAVPTAASTEPTAPSARFRERPNHSIPLVNSSAPIEDDDERHEQDEKVQRLGSPDSPPIGGYRTGSVGRNDTGDPTDCPPAHVAAVEPEPILRLQVDHGHANRAIRRVPDGLSSHRQPASRFVGGPDAKSTHPYLGHRVLRSLGRLLLALSGPATPGFDWFGLLGDLPAFEQSGLWGWLAIAAGIAWLAAAFGLWSLQPWAWTFTVIVAGFALFEAFLWFLEYPGSGVGFASSIMPTIILLYMNSTEVRAAFGKIDTTVPVV